ncbi:dihydrolipoyllysine-residue acetyltransferase component 2 of pyruvate dehydrogenase complex, mitochondrial-like [Hibiscus syriacus]|uniref:dihydrolipoyllysine-residue acetyltransferase component 2 of pyruvate dehydrogenase complex, mitochondrial-like n=1 Tax=Hibiscus syriacus TaxID=106335 RepID=UPI001921591C|nr:dihydrolipoyllysine-residue acetyltransferase component 2 of pyruvate dehydrogenase complex, mitochondrial-like [Hibiscus syriacus]
MAYASHIINHSRKLRCVPKLMRHDHAVLVRWFSNGAQSSICKRDGVVKICHLGAPAERETVSKFVARVPVSSGLSENNLSRTTMRLGIPMGGVVYSRELLCSQVLSRRGFASDAGLLLTKRLECLHSPTMTEGNIARWLKKEGDKVTPGEVLCEVETDKALLRWNAWKKVILLDYIIAITIEEEGILGRDIVKFRTSVLQTQLLLRHHQRRSPVEHQFLHQSRFPLFDTVRHIRRKFQHQLLRQRMQNLHLWIMWTSLIQIRKVTASRLLFSKQTIPHYYLTVDTCVDKLMDLRSQLNSLQEASGGKRISVNDLVIKAAALALRKVPQCNSSWTDDYIRQYNNVNINVAVQTDNGLYVPVIRDADKKGLSSIAAEVKKLAQKAKENSLKPEDYEGGTFTVSNLGGPFGIKQFCAIINPPQSGILAVGSAEKRVIPGSGPDQFNFASYMSVTLSCDHRVIDGAIGAEWLKSFKGYIENPESMLL